MGVDGVAPGPARVVSDGLWCFKAVTSSGASHERTVTGGGAAGVKLEQFRAVNTFLVANTSSYLNEGVLQGRRIAAGLSSRSRIRGKYS